MIFFKKPIVHQDPLLEIATEKEIKWFYEVLKGDAYSDKLNMDFIYYNLLPAPKRNSYLKDLGEKRNLAFKMYQLIKKKTKRI